MTDSHCPNCGRLYDSDMPFTTVRCGGCDTAHELRGRKPDLAETTFICEDCGELNLIPRPKEPELDARKPLIADGGDHG